MRSRIAASTIFLMALSSAWCPRSAAQEPPVPPQELPAGAEVLNRGPVNEAFAEPAAVENQAGLVVPKEPPASIEEVPPENRPEGDHYTWIPGYWSWDVDRDDFVWTGGCWRIAPPDRNWVPGYWARVSEGWEWVAGYWAPVGQREAEYLPPPPPPEDVEAPDSPPDPDDIWVPGCWYWSENRYVLRPGYWLPGQPGWVWMPSQYSWSPQGYVFVAGYWDLPFDERGIVFAPIYFPPYVYGRAGISYSPGVAIDLVAITTSFFAYPGYRHYFFGDYYDDRYRSIGIHPRFDGDRLHTWYDPDYEYDAWRHRRADPEWADRQRGEFEQRQRDRESRPPQTYRELQSRTVGMPETQRGRIEFVQPRRPVVSGAPAPTPMPRRESRGWNAANRQDRSAEARRGLRENPPAPTNAPAPPVVDRERGRPERSSYAPPPTPRPESVRRDAGRGRDSREGESGRTQHRGR